MKEMLMAMKGATLMTLATLVGMIWLMVSTYGLSADWLLAMLVSLPVAAPVIWLLFALIEWMVQEMAKGHRL